MPATCFAFTSANTWNTPTYIPFKFSKIEMVLNFDAMESEYRYKEQLTWKEPQKPVFVPIQIKQKHRFQKTFTGLRFTIGRSKK